MSTFKRKRKAGKMSRIGGTTIATLQFVINLTDLFIIYLACGAPFGVYYFLRNRTQSDLKLLWLKTFLNFLFWIPLAIFLVRQINLLKILSTGFDKVAEADADREKNINLIQKEIEKILMKSDTPISIYEFRETIERYIGLTLAELNDDKIIAEHEREIFRIAPTKNIERGSICLNRRNRKRLSLHQTEARRDFLQLTERILKGSFEKVELRLWSLELAGLANDLEANIELEKIFDGSLQTGERHNVKNLEKDLWKPEIQKPLPAKRISHLPAMNTIVNLRRKG